MRAIAKLSDTNSFAEDVRSGLLSYPKSLKPQYFYDDLGSALFEAICRLPEYYLTRAETEILSNYADKICRKLEEHVTLIEFGSGKAEKTRFIIDSLLGSERDLLYLPIDVSFSALEESSRSLRNEYRELRIEPLAVDYYTGMEMIKSRSETRKFVLFLGSNIGNMYRDEAIEFLTRLRSILHRGDHLLIGMDLLKDKKILLPAYNDSLGVTAAFNKNLLVRINRELGGNFQLERFNHLARFNKEEGCVQMYLESTSDQVVRIEKLELDVEFLAGEMIHTENSYKYTIDQIEEFARLTGFYLKESFLDEEKRFSSNLLIARE
jgi:L-histidine Nalpha-methyltransferase